LLEQVKRDIVDYHVIAVRIKLLYILFFINITVFDIGFVWENISTDIEDISYTQSFAKSSVSPNVETLVLICYIQTLTYIRYIRKRYTRPDTFFME